MKKKIEIEIEYGSEFQREMFEVMFVDIIHNFASFFESKHKKNYFNSEECYKHGTNNIFSDFKKKNERNKN